MPKLQKYQNLFFIVHKCILIHYLKTYNSFTFGIKRYFLIIRVRESISSNFSNFFRYDIYHSCKKFLLIFCILGVNPRNEFLRINYTISSSIFNQHPYEGLQLIEILLSPEITTHLCIWIVTQFV